MNLSHLLLSDHSITWLKFCVSTAMCKPLKVFSNSPRQPAHEGYLYTEVDLLNRLAMVRMMYQGALVLHDLSPGHCHNDATVKASVDRGSVSQSAGGH